MSGFRSIYFEIRIGTQAVTVDSADNVWFTSDVDHRASIVEVANEVLRHSWPGDSDSIYQGIVADHDRNVWYADRSGALGRIARGKVPKTLVRFKNIDPTWLALGPPGCVWFTAPRANSIGLSCIAGSRNQRTTVFRTNAPGQIATASDGSAWFAIDHDSAIARISLDGKITKYLLPVEGPGIAAIRVLFDGRVCFAELGRNRLGCIFSQTGRMIEYLNPGTSAYLHGIIVDPTRNVILVAVAGSSEFLPVWSSDELIVLRASDLLSASPKWIESGFAKKSVVPMSR